MRILLNTRDDFQQGRVEFDAVAVIHQNFLHHARRRRRHLGRDLHRTDERQRLALRDRLTKLDERPVGAVVPQADHANGRRADGDAFRRRAHSLGTGDGVGTWGAGGADPADPHTAAAVRKFHATGRVAQNIEGGVEEVTNVGEFHSLPMYSPDRVSTRMRSPGWMKTGTWSWWPVSSVASFVAPLTRSPLTPASEALMVSVIAAGSSTVRGLPSR